MADKVTLRIQPLFPVQEISRLASHRTLPPDPGQPRQGVALPITVIYDHLSGRPAAFIELGFKPDGNFPEPLSPEHWDAIRRQFELLRSRTRIRLTPFQGGTESSSALSRSFVVPRHWACSYRHRSPPGRPPRSGRARVWSRLVAALASPTTPSLWCPRVLRSSSQPVAVRFPLRAWTTSQVCMFSPSRRMRTTLWHRAAL